MKSCLPVLVALLLPALGAAPVSPSPTRVRESIELLTELARIPSESSNREGVREAAEWLMRRFGELGFETRLLEAGEEANPAVFAERRAVPDGADARTVLFYMHYDTQPTGSPEDWASTGGDPFAPVILSDRWDLPGAKALSLDEVGEPELRTARLYARGVADDKAPIVMHLAALRTWLDGGGGDLNMKFILDGEEEAGSPHIGRILDQYGESLRADLLVLCDGPMDALGRRSVYLGTRGDMHMRLRVATARLPAHSGNYGLLPNAAWKLAWLLSTMKDGRGNVTIDGFLDDVVAPTTPERFVLAEASRAEPVIARRLGTEVFEGDPLVPYYERLLFRPGLVINHLQSGRPGNQIPVTAEALLEVRLVPRQEPEKVYETLRRHVRKHMPEASLEYLGGSAAGRMDPEDPVISGALEAAREAAGGDLLVYPSLGGTLPLLHLFEAAGYKYIGLPLVNFDNNQHVGNENLALGALADGIEFLGRFYDRLARQ